MVLFLLIIHGTLIVQTSMGLQLAILGVMIIVSALSPVMTMTLNGHVEPLNQNGNGALGMLLVVVFCCHPTRNWPFSSPGMAF
jgi:hypothetical protein